MVLGSSESGNQEVTIASLVDQLSTVGHGAIFGVFAWLLHRALVTTPPPPGRSLRHRPPKRLLWFACLGAISYGVITELYQGLLPHRSAQLSDALANALGVACYFLYARRRAVRAEPVVE